MTLNDCLARHCLARQARYLSHSRNSHPCGSRPVPASALVRLGVARLDVTRCRPVLRTSHIASLIYAIVPWLPCPLTMAETWLEARAGIEPACGPFLVRVLDAVSKTDKSDVEW